MYNSSTGSGGNWRRQRSRVGVDWSKGGLSCCDTYWMKQDKKALIFRIFRDRNGTRGAVGRRIRLVLDKATISLYRSVLRKLWKKKNREKIPRIPAVFFKVQMEPEYLSERNVVQDQVAKLWQVVDYMHAFGVASQLAPDTRATAYEPNTKHEHELILLLLAEG